VAVSPTGPEAGDIYVANLGSGTVSVINPATNTVVATLPVGSEPNLLAVSPAGPEAGDVYVPNAGSGTASVINPATNTVTATINVGGGRLRWQSTPPAPTSTSATGAAATWCR
jgi:YVTN family beta-propeller protein